VLKTLQLLSSCVRSDSLAAGYAAVLHLRSATRVLQLIHQQQLDPDLPAGETVREQLSLPHDRLDTQEYSVKATWSLSWGHLANQQGHSFRAIQRHQDHMQEYFNQGLARL
jgi:hypothetical protein